MRETHQAQYVSGFMCVQIVVYVNFKLPQTATHTNCNDIMCRARARRFYTVKEIQKPHLKRQLIFGNFKRVFHIFKKRFSI